MIIENTALSILLSEPVTKLANWIFGKALVATKNRKIKDSLQGLAEKITDVAKVKTIYKNDSSIDLHEFYIPTRVRNINIKINKIIDIDKKNIIIEGTVGQGKSIFMRYLTYQEAKLGKRIPIFLELRKLENNQSLEDAISSTIAEWIPIFSKKNFHVLAESGDLFLFLDGFDEVSRDNLKRLLNEIERWHRYYPKMQMVISSRPGDDIQNINAFKVYQLDPYRYPEQKALINKLVQEEDARNILKKSIEESPSDIKSLITTPLMVTLYVMIYRALSELPKTQSEFYKNIFSILSTRHDKTKPGYKREFSSKLSESKLQKIFEEFCFMSFKKDELIFSYPRAVEIIDICIKDKDIQADPSNILQDFSKVVCLLPIDGLNYTFVHKSIQEYFSASFIIGKSEAFKSSFYSSYLTKFATYSKMKSIIDFLKDGDEYSYNKYYKIPFLKEYIDFFEINQYSNKIIDNILIENNVHDKLNIRLITKGYITSVQVRYPKNIQKISKKYPKNI
ncbi:NACHT domain-containing protein [Psychrobacter sp. ANT_H56B]|uniref:NACHT domain-containing protein n=1 Tax=Psychrobacter sp. ANT_H56B TaxID=2597353 RepID=UPI0011F0AD4A|nr:NACHT domain-containing protein [Psychrobacter sp. ANT_H56B]KAA0924758.1 NACHT domain-containing protein [Psychrobacter sp. ANT_H56B]